MDMGHEELSRAIAAAAQHAPGVPLELAVVLRLRKRKVVVLRPRTREAAALQMHHLRPQHKRRLQQTKLLRQTFPHRKRIMR